MPAHTEGATALTTPFDQLSFAGRLRRLRVLAIKALAQYDLDHPEVAYFGFATNLLYQVTTAAGERFALRIASPGWRTSGDLQAEALWLRALARDTAICAPRVMSTRQGDLVPSVAVPGVPSERNVTLMTWLPGRTLGHYLNERNLAKMGELFAGLHRHGAAWVPPIGFAARRFDHWLSRGEANLIVPDGQLTSAAPNPAGPPVLPSSQRDLLRRMHLQVEAAYAAVDRSDLRVIHCDLWHDNIKLHKGTLHPFDFEDTVLGFRAHDIAMAMLDLLEATGEERYPTLLAAFRREYEAHLAWPADRIEPFQVGRLLWKINWFARRRPERFPEAVARHVPVFEHFERTGEVVLPAPV